jgi:hypothetical protein
MQYLRDNAGVLEASADGTTWEAVVLGTGGGGTPSELANPVTLGGIWLRENDGFLQYSENGTDYWSLLSTPETVESPVNLGTLKLQDNAGALEVSNDGGVSWEAVALGEGGGGGQTITVVDSENTNFFIDEIDGRLVILKAGYDAALPVIQSETGYFLITFNAQGNNSKVFPNAVDYITLISGGGSPGQGIDLTLGATIQLCGHLGQWFEVLSAGTVTLIV